MLSFPKRPIYFSKSLSDYCTRTTNESIKKITEKCGLERNKQKKINLPEEDNDNGKPDKFFYNILCFIYTSFVTYFFYKAIK